MEYSIPDTYGTARWINIGTLTTSQGGHASTLIINTSEGYNGTDSQIRNMELRFTTSNNSDGRVASNGQVFLGNSIASGHW